MTQQPIVNTYTNPFDLSDKEIILLEPNTILSDYIEESNFNRIFRVVLNGEKLEKAAFNAELKDGDIVHIYIEPSGDVLKTIGFTSIEFAFGLVKSGYDAYIESLMPDLPDNPTSLKTTKQSPSYNLRAQSNLERLGEAIPTQYGKFRWYPDLAARPWGEFVAPNEFVIHQLFCLGHGEFTINQIKLGTLDIDNSETLEAVQYDPGDSVTLFNTNIYTNQILDTLEMDDLTKFLYTLDGTTSESLQFSRSGKEIIILNPRPEVNFQTIFSPGDTISLFPHFSSIDPIPTELGLGSFTIDTVVLEGGGTRKIIVIETPLFPRYGSSASTTNDRGNWAPSTSYSIDDGVHPTGDLDTGFVAVSNHTSGTVEATDLANTSLWTEILIPFANVYFSNQATNTENNMELTNPSTTSLTNTTGADNVQRLHPKNSVIKLFENDFLFKQIPGTGNEYDIEISFDIFFDEGLYLRSPLSVSPIVFSDYTADFDVHFINLATNMVYDTQSFSITRNSTFPIALTQFVIGSGTIGAGGAAIPVDEIGVLILRADARDLTSDNLTFSKGRIKNLKTTGVTVENFGAFTFLATKLKTNTLTQDASIKDKVNVIATRKLLIWNGSTWTGPTATRSIAWALADIWMSTYGASRSDQHLDTDALLALDSTWTARGDTFDGVFDSQITVWEGLKKVARVGRTRPEFDETGVILTFIRDEVKIAFSAVFTPDNILPGSFNIEYQFSDNQSPDGVIIKYLDEDNNYLPARVESTVGLTKPIEVDFFGCVNYEQAWRESQFLEARFLRQRVFVQFNTELGGYIPSVGDLISVQHDLPSWGQGGQVTNKSGTTITTSQPLDFSGSAPFLMSFMEPNGNLSGPHTVTQGSGEFEAILDTDVTDFTFITTLNNQNPTVYQFGPSTNWNKPCIVNRINVGANNETLTIGCVPFDQEIHDADTGTVDPKPESTPSATPIPPKIGGLILSNAPGSGSVVATWNPLFNIDNYKVEKSTDNIVFTPVSTPSVPTETISATGTLYVRVASVISATVGEFAKQVIIAT